jgi:putative protein-disulfide isomerase
LLKVFRAFQHAFYVAAVDTTDGALLAKVGAEALSADGHSVTPDEFLSVWQSKSTIDAASADFIRARSMGVTSFPTLFLAQQGSLRRVGNGYAHVETLEHEIDALLAA